MAGVNLKDWGWNARFAQQFSKLPKGGLIRGRITTDAHGAWKAVSPLGELDIHLPGKFRQADAREKPVVGDWVAIDQTPNNDFVVEVVLERQTQILRQAAGRRTQAQVLAANVDLIFVISSLNEEFKPRRLERYLVAAWESGARPVVLLSKLDLCKAPADLIDAARAVALGVPVIAYSALSGIGLATIRKEIKADFSVVLLGSSGVGKSTLVNKLLGSSRFKTGPIRDSDKRGRHTTTHRELVKIPSGGLLIDTPGLRELQLWDTEIGLENAFPDIDRLANECRFSDCSHEKEPDCAVQGAVESGVLPRERFESYLKLRREADRQRRRIDVAEAQAEKRRTRSLQKLARKRIQEKKRTGA